eukprot:CAMPEP_0197323770 /NCGR_PEP_ID=MMETSP0891-20130614/70723_1 /TAXON_ID=44058 ORGANISM="Aureoumbra lagunensis, Strain CCMP1510" /NCGR_SAMPLE_ID=MMETSP0891 /ASSEMBLY_ACC=CAM_ASM_000534 /LENGTH=189 /DNA_ID=CAMNT_0042816483 /DNA_START=1071 /DNA_END=1639 /DNA_ORIENTATION=-
MSNYYLKMAADPSILDKKKHTPRDHLMLGMSAKTVRRQDLDDYLASFRIFTGKHEAKKPAKAIVDYKKCQVLLDRLDGVGLTSGSYIPPFLLRLFLFSDVEAPPEHNESSSDKKLSTNQHEDYAYFPCLNSCLNNVFTPADDVASQSKGLRNPKENQDEEDDDVRLSEEQNVTASLLPPVVTTPQTTTN